jgi:hypothetical protein
LRLLLFEGAMQRQSMIAISGISGVCAVCWCHAGLLLLLVLSTLNWVRQNQMYGQASNGCKRVLWKRLWAIAGQRTWGRDFGWGGFTSQEIRCG